MTPRRDALFPPANPPSPLAAPPAAPGASPGAPSAPPQRLLTPDQVSAWRRRAQAALDSTKDAIEDGKTNVARYQGKYLQTAPREDTALVPTDFYYTEAKKAQIFYRLPDVFVKPGQPGLDDAAVVFQAALNQRLGPAGVHVLPTVHQVIHDVICATGFGALKIGHHVEVDPAQPTVPVQVGQEPDPTAPPPPPQPGSVLGLAPPAPAMRPIMAEAPNIVAEWDYVEHVLPGDLLVPPDFVGMDFDKAPWIGIRFREDLPDDAPGGSSPENDRRLTPLPQGAEAARRKQRTGYEIWYRAMHFDQDLRHPDAIRYFTFYEGGQAGDPVEVKPHPDQRLAPNGKLLAGMRGYPISAVTLRYTADTWLSKSDCTMARNTADELSTGRTQMLRSRDRNMPQWGYDATRVDKDIQAKIEQNELCGIGFNGPGADATWPIAKGDSPRESYEFNGILQGDLQRIWRLGSNQIGVMDDKVRSASEQQITANAAQEAMEADRTIILAWYVDKVVAKYAALLQLYADEPQFVELVGADAKRLETVPPDVQQQAQQTGQDARVLVPWNKDLIQGVFAFSAKPNSQLFVDTAQEVKQLMDLYRFFANSPNTNLAELERAILVRVGLDPSKCMQTPPPKQAPAPTGSFAFAGADFNPVAPQAPIVLDILNKLGVPVDPAAIQAGMQLAAQIPPQVTPPGGVLHAAGPQQAHGGAVAEAENLSKHAAALTGGMQKTGAPAPMGAGGRL